MADQPTTPAAAPEPPAFVPEPSTGPHVAPIAPKASPVVPKAAAGAAPAKPVLLDTATKTNSLKPVPLIIPKEQAPPQPLASPPGWWKLEGVKGAKAAVAKAVSGNAGIPAHWQAALQAEINAHPSEAVAISAHFSQENKQGMTGAVKTTTKGKLVLHIDISPIDGYVS